MTIKLKESVPLTIPVTFDGTEKTEIEVRRLKAKDLREVDDFKGGGVEKTLHLIRRLSGWPPEAVDELDGADIEAISKVIEGFSKRRR